MANEVIKKPIVKNRFGYNDAIRVSPIAVKSSGWPLGMSADQATPKPKISKTATIQPGASAKIKTGWF